MHGAKQDSHSSLLSIFYLIMENNRNKRQNFVNLLSVQQTRTWIQKEFGVDDKPRSVKPNEITTELAQELAGHLNFD